MSSFWHVPKNYTLKRNSCQSSLFPNACQDNQCTWGNFDRKFPDMIVKSWMSQSSWECSFLTGWCTWCISQYTTHISCTWDPEGHCPCLVSRLLFIHFTGNKTWQSHNSCNIWEMEATILYCLMSHSLALLIYSAKCLNVIALHNITLTLIQLWKKYSHTRKCGVRVDPDNDSCQTLFKCMARYI